MRQNHTENKDTEKPGIGLSTEAVNITTDIPAYISIQDILEALQKDKSIAAKRIHHKWMATKHT